MIRMFKEKLLFYDGREIVKLQVFWICYFIDGYHEPEATFSLDRVKVKSSTMGSDKN